MVVDSTDVNQKEEETNSVDIMIDEDVELVIEDNTDQFEQPLVDKEDEGTAVELFQRMSNIGAGSDHRQK